MKSTSLTYNHNFYYPKSHIYLNQINNSFPPILDQQSTFNLSLSPCSWSNTLSPRSLLNRHWQGQGKLLSHTPKSVPRSLASIHSISFSHRILQCLVFLLLGRGFNLHPEIVTFPCFGFIITFPCFALFLLQPLISPCRVLVIESASRKQTTQIISISIIIVSKSSQCTEFILDNFSQSLDFARNCVVVLWLEFWFFHLGFGHWPDWSSWRGVGVGGSKSSTCS